MSMGSSSIKRPREYLILILYLFQNVPTSSIININLSVKLPSSPKLIWLASGILWRSQVGSIIRFPITGPTCPGLYGFHPPALEAFGPPPKPFGVCPRIPCGAPWSHKATASSVQGTWETMGNHGKPWETMGNHGKPWETTVTILGCLKIAPIFSNHQWKFPRMGT